MRSESDILRKVITLKFGGKEYEVPVLRMVASAKWRKEWFEKSELASPKSSIVEDVTDKESVRKALGNALLGSLIEFPEKIPDLVFSYAPSLPREEIMEVAYDEEFATAVTAIWEVAFTPFLTLLGTVNMMLKGTASRSASSGSLN